MKSADGLFKVGAKLSAMYPDKYWDDVMESTSARSMFLKHSIDAFELRLIRNGYTNHVAPAECPSPDAPFPFGKPKNYGRRYRDVHPDYYKWFLSEEWCDKWPQVLAYCKFYKDALEAKSLQLAFEEDEVKGILKDINNL